MSDASSEESFDLSFSFSTEDLTKIDASIEAAFQRDQCVGDASLPTEIGGRNTASSPAEGLTEQDVVSSQTSTIPVDNVDDTTFNSSFASDAFDLNIGTLSAEELELIDVATSGSLPESESPPVKSPLRQFRSYKPLSVTDLCAPSWCEVQYDYGLRGMRSRPLAKRPRSFLSSSGKTISPAVPIAQNNDIITKQGQTIHKELEREVKFEELQVEITTDETRWALRLVNMIACLRGIMTGFTREMPVFGIIHDEVVVGIMDEVVKGEIPHPDQKSRSVLQSRKATTSDDSIPEGPAPISEPSTSYALYIKDSKTRKRDSLPSDADMYSGRIQLMIYRRLLSELVSTNPPYDFRRLWDKLGIDSTEVFPTRFLVQAQLIEESDQFKTACLDDLVNSWHKLVKEFNVVGVDPQLELIYRLQPPQQDRKGKDKETQQNDDKSSVEDEDLAKAIAASLRDMDSGEQTPVAGPSNLDEPISVTAQDVIEPINENATILQNSSDEVSNSDDIQLQWALQQSILPQADCPDTPNISESTSKSPVAPPITRKGKSKSKGKKGKTIWEFVVSKSSARKHSSTMI
ncbi:exonuclease V a 5' deoxyribonuclease-domain-containing protein [Pholiota molesta]|nr:exonuclease V a 5' deoxyribonuclease-domain-containing protein [Pholiota molesta]